MRRLAASSLLMLFAVLSASILLSLFAGDVIRLLWEASRFFGSGAAKDDDDAVGTRWAILIAGSNRYRNYRQQADVCHAYQLLIKGGLKEENIVVFMYDDIASNEENPRPGIVINSPHGSDVYKRVPKDYTGEGKMLPSKTSWPLSLETKLLLQEAVGRLWTVVPTTISSFTMQVMGPLGCLVCPPVHTYMRMI
ncbi:hypothetical protein Q3G72_008653 [Acer saccharum]|nr:hypothetical protein Q3G72_008653 [Acer saccharum]